MRLSSAAARHVLLLALALAATTRATADEPLPEPQPTPPSSPSLGQDELDFSGRSSLVLGSGARALGMAGAFLARADDGTAASWNPAGLSYLRRPEVSIVGTRNVFETTTTATTGAVVLRDEFLGYSPDFLAAAVPFRLGAASGVAQLSYQRTFSFFAGTRTIEKGANPPITHTGEGGFDVLALGTGVQLSRQWRLGFTVNRWINGFEQTREREAPRDTRQRSRFDFSGWNFNLGAIWTPIESLNVGLVVRTPFNGPVDLDRSRVDSEDTPNASENWYTSERLQREQGVLVSLDFPGAVGAGLSWRARNGLTLSGDYTRSFWSQGKVFNYFVLEPSGTPEPFEELPWPSLVEEQVDTEQIRVGVEYVLIGRAVLVPLRVGYFNDRQYVRVGGSVPRFNGFTAGAGIAAGPVLFDVAYLHEFGDSRTSEATTEIRVRRVYVSMIYRHGER